MPTNYLSNQFEIVEDHGVSYGIWRETRPCFTAPRSGTNSLIPGGREAQEEITRYLHSSGLLVEQGNARSGLLAHIPGISAAIIPPNALPPSGWTGWTHGFYLPLFGSPQEHPPIGYPQETIDERFKNRFWRTGER
jgi:hypothetical protein